MMKRKHVAPPDPLSPTLEVFAQGGPDGDFGGEDIRGKDDKPIYPGRTVKREPVFSKFLGVTAPARHGVAKRLYRVERGGPVIVETTNGHHFLALDCVRSTKGEAGEREHRRLIEVNQAGQAGRAR